MRDEEKEERDPVTQAYPFMLAASAETWDLSAIYHSLVQKPGCSIVADVWNSMRHCGAVKSESVSK